MELFFVDRASLACLPPEARAWVDPNRLREALDRAGVPEGMPFLVGDDGQPVKEVNDFFRELPSLGCRSQDTWRAYALDVFRFARYLSAVEGVPPFGATVEHVERYRWMRLQGQRPVRASTWNREMAALQRFYSWAQRRGHVATPPFRFGSGGREGRNLARARVGDDAPIRYLTVEQYLFFRDVGLFGLGLDGRRDLSFGGEHALRNKLFADMLVTTGLRLQEASSLTRVELPGPSTGAATLAIAGPTAKRSKPRDVLVPARVLDNLRFYARSARAEMVERAVRSGRLPGPGDVAVSLRGRRVVASDGSFDADLAVIDSGRRWRLVEVGDGVADPLALFVGRSGRPVRPQAWERVFEAASHRCESFAGGPGVPTIGRVTPHMLRHTFAVHTLSALLTEQLRRGQDESPRGHPGRVALRQVAENPLRRLQRLLGHSQVATTYAYLDCLDEANELVEAALARWDTDASWADVAKMATG